MRVVDNIFQLRRARLYRRVKRDQTNALQQPQSLSLIGAVVRHHDGRAVGQRLYRRVAVGIDAKRPLEHRHRGRQRKAVSVHHLFKPPLMLIDRPGILTFRYRAVSLDRILHPHRLQFQTVIGRNMLINILNDPLLAGHRRLVVNF